MKKIINLNIGLVLFVLASAFYIAHIYSACSPAEQFKSVRITDMRSDGRCNTDGDCAPGRQCNSFGYCEACR